MSLPSASPTESSAILHAMAAAVKAASAFRGATVPNPPVGCALLDEAGGILAVEVHRRAGAAHAEAAAIALCREWGIVDRIHTVVVTLEPCNHHGRTPPCTDAILSTPARRVVIGARDPNPAVPGKGADRLRTAGLAVDAVADLPVPDAAAVAADCADLVAPFRKRTMTGRPYVTVKQALDSAGSMIPPPGVKTFTSPAALRYAHALRRRADAVLTGSGTVLADDPAFTVRHVPDHPGKRRQLAILDRRRRVHSRYVDASRARGFDAFVADDLGGALDRLGAAGTLEVLVEAGPTLTAAVIEAGLWDEHAVIRKGGGEGGADRLDLRRRDGGEASILALV